jgi:hypothetical protein
VDIATKENMEALIGIGTELLKKPVVINKKVLFAFNMRGVIL